MVSHCTLDLISWKILLKTCCLKCLTGYDSIRWWAKLSDSCWIHPYLNTDPVVNQLTHYMGLYDLNRKWSFCCFSNLFENSLNVQCIHDISYLLWKFWWEYKIRKNYWSQHGRRLISLSKALGITIIDRWPLAGAIAYKLSFMNACPQVYKKQR